MWKWIHISILELVQGRKRLWLPGLALTIAVAALFLFRAFQTQIEAKLSQEGQVAMGGDLAIEAFKDIPETILSKIQNQMPPGTLFTQFLELNTMLQVNSTRESRFVRLIVVDSQYPFYTVSHLEPPIYFRDLDISRPEVVLPSDLASLLNLKIGDRLRLGQTDFYVRSVLSNSKNSLGNFLSFAPSIWIHQRHLRATGLLDRPGRVSYQYRLKIPGSKDNLNLLRLEIKEILNDLAFRVTTFNESERGFQRIFDQVQFFAQLMTLAALLLSGFAVFGAFQNWLFERRYWIAVLRSLGAASAQIRILLLSSILIFSLVFGLLGLALGALGFHLLAPYVSDLLQFQIVENLDGSVFLFSGFCGITIPFLFSSLALVSAADFKPILLLRSQEMQFGSSRKYLAGSFGIFIYIWMLQLFILKDLRQSIFMSIGLLIALLCGALVAWVGLKSLSRISLSGMRISLLFPLRMLLRERAMSLLGATLFFILAFILGAMVYLENSLQSEFKVEEGVRQTSLFVFDLGEADKQEVDHVLERDLPETTIEWAPWVRVRWKTVNGIPLASDQEEEEDAQFNSEFLVSESLHLPDRERIVEGKFWQTSYEKSLGKESHLPEVSLTRDFAKRFKVKVGDRLGFEMYGVPFFAKVTNFRIVRWTDFQPGFRILFQKGIFSDAPFSYLAGIQAEGDESRLTIRRIFNQELPGIPVVDIAQVKQDLIRILSDLGMALRGILSFLMLLGIVLVAVLAQEKVNSRTRDFATLRCLGASASQLKIFLMLEVGLLAFIPSILGVFMGGEASRWILHHYLNIEGSRAGYFYLAIPLLILTLVALVTWRTSNGIHQIKPRQAFQE